MKTLLVEAHKAGFSSIAFPAMGTGNLKYPPDTVAKAMFQAFLSFGTNNSGTSIKDVRFILYDKDIATVNVSEITYVHM